MTYKSGSSSVMLITIIMIVTLIVTAAVAVSFTIAQDSLVHVRGDAVLSAAASGAENGILRLLRDPSYAGESNLPIGSSNVTITVAGTSPKIVTSTAVSGNTSRSIQAQVAYSAGQLIIAGWQEL